MSTPLALAAVTHVIREVLLAAEPENHEVLLDGAVWDVTTLAPDLIERAANKPPALNLFLYHVAPNRGWRNEDARTHDAGGQRIASPPLALDLRYLLTAYGSKNYQAEVLLGQAMLALHDRPVLSRDLIAASFNPATPIETMLAGSGIDAQVEQIRITLESLDADAMLRLWAGLQLGMRPSASYVVTVVLVSSAATARAAAPVATRNIAVAPLDPPRLDRADPVDGPAVPVEPGVTLRITGRALVGPNTTLWLGDTDVTGLVDTAAADYPGALALVLPATLPTGLLAGVRGLQLRVAAPLPGGARPFLTSNIVAVALRPRVTAVAKKKAGDIDGLLVTFAHEIGDRQRVEILLEPIKAGAYDGAAVRLPVPGGNSDVPPTSPPTVPPVPRGDLKTVWLPVTAPAGQYAVRARVDGLDGVRRPVAAATKVTLA